MRLCPYKPGSGKKRAAIDRLLLGSVVKKKSKGPTYAATHLGDSVANLTSRSTPRAGDGAFLDRDNRQRALGERHDRNFRLATRAVLDKHQFPARKVNSRPIKQKDRLQRKMYLTVKILVQAVIVARRVAQQQGRRALLSGGRAALNECIVTARPSFFMAPSNAPIIRHRRQAFVHCLSQGGRDLG